MLSMSFYVHMNVSAPDVAAAAAGASDIMVRTRCVTCARTTNTGSPLGKLGASVPFGRFLLMILTERRLMSEDPSCCHALHGQLLMFSLTQGTQALTALFIHEPVTLTSVDIPSSHLHAVGTSIQERLVSNELMQTLAATEALLTTASAVTKNRPDHPWLASGHVAKVFEIHEVLQRLCLGHVSVDVASPADSDVLSSLPPSVLPKPVPGQHVQDADNYGTLAASGEVADDRVKSAGVEGGVGGESGESSVLDENKRSSKGIQDDLATALKLKTQVLLLAQSLFEDAGAASAVSDAPVGGVNIKSKDATLGVPVTVSSTSYVTVPSFSYERENDVREEDGGGIGELWSGPVDEHGDLIGGAHKVEGERESSQASCQTSGLWHAPTAEHEHDALRLHEAMRAQIRDGDDRREHRVEHKEGWYDAGMQYHVAAANVTGLAACMTPTSSLVAATRSLWPSGDDTGEQASSAGVASRSKVDDEKRENDEEDARREDSGGEGGGGIASAASKNDDVAKKEEGEVKKRSKTLGGISGIAGGVVGGLLHGASGGGGLKDSGKAVRPAHFDSTILSSVAGRCCYVIPGDYLSNGHPLVVHEDEPASLIALALNSKGYQQALVQHARASDVKSDTPDMSGASAIGSDAGGASAAAAAGGVTGDTPSKKASGKGKDVEEERNERERQESHINVTFEAEGACGLAELSCKVYFARSFHQLRRRYGSSPRGDGDRDTHTHTGKPQEEDFETKGTQDFLGALRRCKKWNPTGGRSGSAWLKTADERFVLKEISKKEIAHFLKAAHQYFSFITTTMDSSPPIPSCLAKILGLFKVTTTLRRGSKSGSAGGVSQVLLLTENLLYNGEVRQHPLTRIFDLKGSSRNRFVKEAKAGDVQLDDNFHAYLQQYPLYLTEEAKRLLTVAIHNDTVFLTKINVMDYSLLVALDQSSNKLIVGIIDYIRQYTMDKQAETYYKKAFDRVAMKGSGDGPTVIAPPEYRDRFREAMTRDFIAAPGIFTLGRSGQLHDDPSGVAQQDDIQDKGVSCVCECAGARVECVYVYIFTQKTAFFFSLFVSFIRAYIHVRRASQNSR